MLFPFLRHTSLCVVVVLIVSLFAQRGEAGFAPSGITGTHGDNSVTDINALRTDMELKKIRGKLRALGFTDRETEERLSSLNADEIHQLSVHVDDVRVGGGWTAIGVILLAVIGIIIIYNLFFSKDRNAAPAN